ncbi:MAG TPA: GGDEF domain-containing protein [Povalibacter sp.]
MATRPAQVLQEIQALPADTWTVKENLQAALLITRAQLELGLIDEMTRGLADIQKAVAASGDPALQAQWHALQGCSARGANSFDEAHRQWEKSLTLARAVNDTELQDFVLTQQADVYINRHDLHSAAMKIEADRVLSEASSDEQMKARHFYWSGVLRMTIEDGVRAAALFSEAAQRFKALNNPTWESDSQRLLANALLDSDHPAAARAPAQRAVDLLEQTDDPVYLALAQGSLALALVFNGERSRALDLSRKSATTARSFRDGEWKTSTLTSHADVLWRCGDAEGAIDVLRREVQPRLPAESALPSTNRRFQLVLAEALSAAGRAEEARTAWHDVLRLSRRNFDRVLANQLTVQRAELEKQRLQRENELLEQRSQQFERALKAESHARSMTTLVVLLVLGAAVAAVLWLRRVNRRIAAAAATDALTGLLNRRSALELGRTSLLTARRDQRPLSVLVLDVDHFKRVNDTHGHATGDDALRSVAAVLRQYLRRSDLLARWGGEEFLVVLPDADDGIACGLAERLRAAIATIEIPNRQGVLNITTSIGLASLESIDADLEETIARADRALYRAKREGRNRVIVYDGLATGSHQRHAPLDASALHA